MDLFCFGIYILAESMTKPEIYGVKIQHLGEDVKPDYEIYKYHDEKIKIFAKSPFYRSK